MNTTIFGIRHHGPGSAQSLVKALEELQPDCILIEGPADAQDVMLHATNAELIPPVAILIYNPKNLAQASYFPFAEFSPEWQAIQFGLKNVIPITFMDLPMQNAFAIKNQQPAEQQITLQFDQASSHLPILPSSNYNDPISHIAQLSGYTDSERWWEVTFEQAENETAVFTTILEMMTALREEINRPEPPETLLREAYMRSTMRKAAQNFQNIAVVCGAWHAPVLQNWENFKKKDDGALLKKLPAIKTQATWIPWSYKRLAFQSGYSAGVLSPAWYAQLFRNRREATTFWMSQAAQLFRKEGHDTSAADVIEAIRLANTLATLRGLSIAGRDELREAAVTILCRGKALLLELIENKLITGEVVGQVPHDIAAPLQQDFEDRVKKIPFLKKNYPISKTDPQALDLRVPAQLAASHLLHQLRILDIPWGTLLPASENQKGSFKEIWELDWQPEFAITLIEAGVWGSTVYEAAVRWVLQKASDESQLVNLTQLAEEVLQADLREAIEPLLQHLQNAAALATDVSPLMDALEPLVRIIRYGNVRKTDTEAVEKVVNQLIPRICIGLPNASQDIDDDLAQVLLQKILNTNQALALLHQKEYLALWQQSLAKLVQQVGTHELLRGFCTRLLFNMEIFNINITSRLLHFALSERSTPTAPIQWLEGFLQGSGLLLLHHQALWTVLNDWVAELSLPQIEAMLPLLRRAFSNFTHSEREKILQKAAQPDTLVSTAQFPDYDADRGERVLPTVRLLLGI